MDLIKYDPRELMESFFGFGRDFNPFREMEQMIERTFGHKPIVGEYRTPVVNVEETEKAYKLNLEIPGVEKDKICVNLEDKVLTIKAGDTKEEKVEKEGYKSHAKSTYSYQRSFVLPQDTLADKITSSYKNGVLQIEIPKAEEKKPETKQIPIK